MKNSKMLTLFICLLFSMPFGIIAQNSKSQSDSAEASKMNKWIRIAKKEYPTDTLRQNISIFANSFWGDRENAKIIKNGIFILNP